VLNFRVWLHLVGSAVLLSRLDPLLVLLPLFGLGAFSTGRRAHRLQEATREANAERGRLKGHLFRLATSADAGKELRVFGLADAVIGRHRAVAEAIQRANHRTAWRATALGALGSLLFAVGYVGAIALVLARAVAGAATPGGVVLAVALAAQLNGTVALIVDWGDFLRRAVRAATRYL
jgi:ATP-binding cassette subfamily B protein